MARSGFVSATVQAAEVAYLSMDSHIHLVYTSIPAGSFSDGDITQIARGATATVAGTPLVAFAWDASKAMQVEYTTPDGHLHEIYWKQVSGWQHADLTSATGAARPRVETARWLHSGLGGPDEKHWPWLSSENEIHDHYTQNGVWMDLESGR